LRLGCITCTIARMKCLAKHLCGMLLACGLAQFVTAQEQGGEIWLLVDTVNLRLMVMQGTQVVHTYGDISIGRDGVSREKTRGDQRTPVGRFRIAWIREESGFHRFLGLDYPDRERAWRARENMQLEEGDWHAIRRAHESGKIPPQGTPLGGQIGIHGIGEGDPEIHGRFNWTNGCVALTNEQLDELMQWVHIGTRVDIR
jgi:murein L,D-transpeptidase YafK